MAETWNATFDVKPQGSDTVGTMDNFIVATRQAVRERVAKEHLFDFAANSQQGLHKMGSARVWTAEEGSEPVSPIPTGTTTETVGNEGEGRLLMIVDGSGNPTGVVKQWVGTVAAGAWVVIGTNAATANTLVARDASGDFSAHEITADLLGDADTLDGEHSTAFATAAQGALADTAMQTTTLQSGIAGTYGTQSISKGSNWVIPSGTYMMSAVSDSTGIGVLQIKDGSTNWNGNNQVSGIVISDGVNFRIFASGYSVTVYYRKLY